MPNTEGSKTTEILMALLMKAIGIAVVIFASLKITDPSLKQTLIEWGLGLIGVAGGTYIIGRSIRKIGLPIAPAPDDDKAAAAVVAATK